MKKILALLIITFSFQTYAQLPEAFNYQATIRAESGEILTNSNINFKVTIYEGQGVVDPFIETHFVSTDDLGHVNFIVGYGQAIEGDISQIDWSIGNYYLQIELDTGQGFVNMGETQLLSVPYALYALDSGGEASDLQSVLDAGSDAEILLSDENLEGVKVMSTGGDTQESNYNGVQSIISGTNGRNIALSGISNGENSFRNYGVWGSGEGSLGRNTGVQGTANGDIGQENRGVFGWATGAITDGYNYGVTGVANNSAGFNIAGGFYAEYGDVESIESYGVSARASVTSSTGTNYGVFANAYGALNNFGIYATAPSASEGSSNFAGYFSGDVYVDQAGYLKAENTPVEDNDVVNKAYLESILLSYDERLTDLENLVSDLQEAGSFLVDQDGNVYATEVYGNDKWALNNSKVVTYRDGTPIPYVATLTDAFESTYGAWTYSSDSEEILYNYKAVEGIWDADSAGDPSQRKELAPEGWHVPTHQEWTELNEYMSNNYSSDAGFGAYAKAVASKEGWLESTIDYTPGFNPEDNNQSNFNIPPVGFGQLGTQDIQSVGDLPVYWTGVSDQNTDIAGYFFIQSNTAAPYLSNITSGEGVPKTDFFLSVRFVEGEATDDGNGTNNDLDGDGYSSEQGDCNDSDPSIYPGAVEICDQVDNNCNGSVDETELGDSFLGDYTLTFVSGGIAATANYPVFGNGVVVTLQGATNSNLRTFNSQAYADYGGQPGDISLLFDNCTGNTLMNANFDTGIGCNSSIVLGPNGSTSYDPGLFSPADDNSFSLVFVEDINGASCTAEAVTTYTFTKN
jgi:uncharacterized protein (TIGR02145 family)